jgi:hypothetical protein
MDFRGIVVARSIALLAALAALLVVAPGAGAAELKPFNQFNRGCVADHGIRACYGTIANRVPSFDGVPLDADIGFPAEGDGRTFAEMGAEAKNELSHRGRAFRGLLSELARR